MKNKTIFCFPVLVVHIICFRLRVFDFISTLKKWAIFVCRQSDHNLFEGFLLVPIPISLLKGNLYEGLRPSSGGALGLTWCLILLEGLSTLWIYDSILQSMMFSVVLKCPSQGKAGRTWETLQPLKHVIITTSSNWKINLHLEFIIHRTLIKS